MTSEMRRHHWLCMKNKQSPGQSSQQHCGPRDTVANCLRLRIGLCGAAVKMRKMGQTQMGRITRASGSQGFMDRTVGMVAVIGRRCGGLVGPVSCGGGRK